MEVQIKSFRMPVSGVYVIITTRGLIDIAGFKQILHKIAALAQPPLDCKILIDLHYVWGTLHTRFFLFHLDLGGRADLDPLKPQISMLLLMNSRQIYGLPITKLHLYSRRKATNTISCL
jgi:hypothetical protein